MSAIYADSSAVLDWLLEAPGGPEAGATLGSATIVAASTLTVAEVSRSLHRLVAAGALQATGRERAWAVFRSATAHWQLHEISRAVLDRAGEPFPVEPLRTLDAIHLATALGLSGLLAPLAVLTHDARMADNARALGLGVRP